MQVKTKVTTSNPKSENIQQKKKFHMKHYDNIEIKLKVMTSVARIYQILDMNLNSTWICM